MLILIQFQVVTKSIFNAFEYRANIIEENNRNLFARGSSILFLKAINISNDDCHSLDNRVSTLQYNLVNFGINKLTSSDVHFFVLHMLVISKLF